MTLTDSQLKLGFFGLCWVALWAWVWFDTRPRLEEDEEASRDD